MSKTKEALEMALDALDVANSLSNDELIDFRKYGFKVDSDITKMFESVRNSICEALAEQEQEPIGYMAFRDGKPSWDEDCVCKDAVYPVDRDDDRVSVAIYTHPAPANQQTSAGTTREHQVRIRESRQIAASDAYFYARHDSLDTLDRRNVFAAGFKAAWEICTAMLAAAPEAPAAPAWQELSDAEIDDIWELHDKGGVFDVPDFASAISAALRAKNGATK